ncbi:MAG: SDR family oxidoreductase, partial [Lacrimispora sp.]
GTLGPVDILVNSAGMNHLQPAEVYEEEKFDQVMSLNVKGVHTVTQAVGKRFMIPRQYGRIVNLSSVKGLIGTKQDYIAYCTSKGAVNMYTKQLACEWGKYGITCNAIAPTFVRTPINSFQLDDPVFYKTLTDRIPLGRIGREEDVAAAALFLCSDAAAFVSGQILGVDGGLTAMQ